MRRAAVVLGVTLIAWAAWADPYDVRWRNASLDQEVRYFAACRETPEGGCDTRATACAPGTVCETAVDLPVGTYPAVLRASPDGSLWSGPSESRVITVQAVEVPPPDPEVDACRSLACRADFNGDGVVSGADFMIFVRAFNTSCEP